MVDQLIHRFVALIKLGLALLLRDPSELAGQELRQHPELSYTVEAIPGLVLWAAVGAYELPWPAFCQHVLTHLPVVSVRLEPVTNSSKQAQVRTEFAATRLR